MTTDTTAASTTAASAAVDPDTLRSRFPDPSSLVPETAEIAAALNKALANGSVPQSTIRLVHLRTGRYVGNTYATVLLTRAMREAGESEERITAVSCWHDAPYFTEAERAALALVDAVLAPSPQGDRVGDELYARAAAHYDEQGLLTLALAIGQAGFFAPLVLIGRPIPGVPFGQQWRR